MSSAVDVAKPFAPNTAPAATRARRRRRKIKPATLISLIAGGLLLALFAYCILLFSLLAISQNSSEGGNQSRAIAAAQWFSRLSPFERHKGHFNIGTAEAKQSNYDIAQAELERALELTPVSDECAVRQNLAYVFEQQAEAFRQAEDIASANTKFDAARTTLTDAPEECRPPGGSQDQSMGQAEERVQESQDEMNAPPEEGSEQQDGSAAGESEGDGSETEGSEDEGGEDEGEGSTGEGADEEGRSPDQGGGDNDGQQSPEEKKREELQQRQQDSQERQEEANSRDRSDGTSNGKPW